MPVPDPELLFGRHFAPHTTIQPCGDTRGFTIRPVLDFRGCSTHGATPRTTIPCRLELQTNHPPILFLRGSGPDTPELQHQQPLPQPLYVRGAAAAALGLARMLSVCQPGRIHALRSSVAPMRTVRVKLPPPAACCLLLDPCAGLLDTFFSPDGSIAFLFVLAHDFDYIRRHELR